MGREKVVGEGNTGGKVQAKWDMKHGKGCEEGGKGTAGKRRETTMWNT